MKMTIGQVARQVGVGVETIRFYEREGLIDEPARRNSGYRQYSEDVVKRILFIRRAKELGFSLKEIQELLTLRVDPDSTCADVKRRTEAKIADVEQKIEALFHMKQALVKVAGLCSGDGSLSACPILDALGQDTLTLKEDENRQEKNMEIVLEYQCPICQLHFREKSVQQQCEAWCRTHNSCNLQIASQSREARKPHECVSSN